VSASVWACSARRWAALAASSPCSTVLRSPAISSTSGSSAATASGCGSGSIPQSVPKSLPSACRSGTPM
jgi:hypothetical protein